MAYVYRHIRLDKNEPFYIGIGKTEKRAYDKRGRNKIWKDIVSKCQYEVEVLFYNISWEEACKKEIEFINLYGRKDLGKGTLANLTDGGEGALNGIISKEHKNKIAESNKRRVFTDEQRKKMSIRMIERLKDSEFRNKLTIGMRNSEKHKLACRINALKFKGYKHSQEAKEKIAKSKSRKIVQFSLDGEVIKFWDSAKQVQRELKLSQGNISRCCNKQYKTAYGYKWQYL